MSLSNAKITQIVQEATKVMVRYMADKNLTDPRAIIDKVLSPTSGAETSLHSINAQFLSQTGIYPLVKLPVLQGEQAIKQQSALLFALKVQLTAIKDGYSLYRLTNPQKAGAAPAPPVIVSHVHYHQPSFYRHMHWWDGLNRPYYRSYYYSPPLWLDLMTACLRGLVGHSERPQRPTQRANNRNNNENNNGAKIGLIGAVLLVAMAGSALFAALYLTVQTARSVKELYYGENLTANSLKLTSVTAAAAGGVFLGLLIGSAAFAMPVLGAVLMAVIMGGLSFKAANSLQARIQTSERTGSAIDGDSRFVLSVKEEKIIQDKGLSIGNVNEALRALAIKMQVTHKAHNSLLLFSQTSKARANILSLARQLKRGLDRQTIAIDKQVFKLVDETQQTPELVQREGYSGYEWVADALPPQQALPTPSAPFEDRFETDKEGQSPPTAPSYSSLFPRPSPPGGPSEELPPQAAARVAQR